MVFKQNILMLILILFLLFSCDKKYDDIIIFHAPAFSPVISEIKENIKKDLNLNIKNEVSGSQVAIRKVSELNRECDVVISADNILFKKIAPSYFNWRIDFANDEVVLGIGIRAKYIDDVEKNWIEILLNKDVVIGRVNENLGPIGYRTLMIWKLQEINGYPDLMTKLKSKSEKLVEHVSILSALLKEGDIDYGFLYKTSCIKYDIRYKELNENINLSNHEINYSKAEVSFIQNNEQVIINGAPITFSLSIPKNSPNRDNAIKFIKYFIKDNKEVFNKWGYRLFKPEFYGSKEDYKIFKDTCIQKGSF